MLISAHGNSLRALIKHLDQVSEDDIVNLNIPTGQPLVYELDENLKPIKHYYLAIRKPSLRPWLLLRPRERLKRTDVIRVSRALRLLSACRS